MRARSRSLAARALIGLWLAWAAPGAGLGRSAETDPVETALRLAGTNRTELVKAIEGVSAAHRPSLDFLLEHMPAADLERLTASFLLENLELAHQARHETPWGPGLPEELFLNEVLPYACLNERRDPWRRRLRDLCLPLVKDCKTPGEAAQRLNQKLFGLVNVKYSTQRKRPDQSPLETLESGVATCTGLAILLVDACRSVAVPARVAGTPMWANLRGNHTWVEVWDQDWHFTGAAEPDPNGLDRGWFAHDASLARKDEPRHAIYASSFRRTGLTFPLVWAPRLDSVNAVNVTDRYTPATGRAAAGKVRLLVKVMDYAGGKRVRTQVTVTDTADPSVRLDGTSRDESADLNDILPFDVSPGRAYAIRVEDGPRVAQRQFQATTNAQQLVEVQLEAQRASAPPPASCYTPPPTLEPLAPKLATKLRRALDEFFAAPPEKQARWKFASSLDRLLGDHEPAVRQVAWEAYRAAPLHGALKADFEGKQVRFEQHTSPYAAKTVGERPARGWPLFIAMHGGGGAPKEVNDSQWRVMQRYYKDHPEQGGYLYVALRAPNDTWNGFYDVYVYPLVANLIRQFLLFGDVDPNKVFIMGYSHGGYGAFAIGPKMPDRFAAIHASAAAPTDGETTARTLRSTPFTYMIGERDTAYGRIDRCRRFDDTIRKLKADYPGDYPVTMQFIAGNGHTGLPDKDKIADMYPAVRNPAPRAITWEMTDNVIHNLFWIEVSNPGKQQELEAVCTDNRLTVKTKGVAAATILLDGRLIDPRRPVALEVNGRTFKQQPRPGLRTLCRTLMTRGDPDLAFTTELSLRF